MSHDPVWSGETHPWTGADDLDASSPPSGPPHGTVAGNRRRAAIQLPKPGRVRVTGTCQPSNWYADRIGEEFEVEEIHPGFFVVRNPTGRGNMSYSISVADCEPVDGTVPPPSPSREELLAEVERLKAEVREAWHCAAQNERNADATAEYRGGGIRQELADALESMLDLWTRHCAPRVVEEDSQVITSRAALRKAGH